MNPCVPPSSSYFDMTHLFKQQKAAGYLGAWSPNAGFRPHPRCFNVASCTTIQQLAQHEPSLQPAASSFGAVCRQHFVWLTAGVRKYARSLLCHGVTEFSDRSSAMEHKLQIERSMLGYVPGETQPHPGRLEDCCTRIYSLAVLIRGKAKSLPA